MVLNSFYCLLAQNADMGEFQGKVTPLDSNTLNKLRHIFDYRCIVGGGEQIFLLALGVGVKTDLLSLTYAFRVEADNLCVFGCAEVSDIHVGWEDASTLEENGKFKAGAAKGNAAQCGDHSGTKRGGEKRIRHY